MVPADATVQLNVALGLNERGEIVGKERCLMLTSMLTC